MSDNVVEMMKPPSPELLEAIRIVAPTLDELSDLNLWRMVNILQVAFDINGDLDRIRYMLRNLPRIGGGVNPRKKAETFTKALEAVAKEEGWILENLPNTPKSERTLRQFAMFLYTKGVVDGFREAKTATTASRSD